MNKKKKVTILTVLLSLALSGAAWAQSLTLAAPNGGESWIRGTQQNVDWTFAGIPSRTRVKLVLFKDGLNPENKVGNIVENISIGTGGAGTYSWKVGNYQGGTAAAGGGYKIRIRDMDGTFLADDSNNPFTIAIGQIVQANANMLPSQLPLVKKTKFEVTPKTVYNKVSWHLSKCETFGPGKTFNQGLPVDVPDPGGTIIKYGYQRFYDSGCNYGWRLHRSFVFFDLSDAIRQIKGKATVKSVSFSGHTIEGSQPCPSQVWCLDNQITIGNGSGIFGMNFDIFPKHLLADDAATRIATVQRWLDDPSQNFGLVIKAVNEGYLNENGQCVRLSRWTLSFEIE